MCRLHTSGDRDFKTGNRGATPLGSGLSPTTPRYTCRRMDLKSRGEAGGPQGPFTWENRGCGARLSDDDKGEKLDEFLYSSFSLLHTDPSTRTRRSDVLPPSDTTTGDSRPLPRGRRNPFTTSRLRPCCPGGKGATDPLRPSSNKRVDKWVGYKRFVDDTRDLVSLTPPPSGHPVGSRLDPLVCG